MTDLSLALIRLKKPEEKKKRTIQSFIAACREVIMEDLRKFERKED